MRRPFLLNRFPWYTRLPAKWGVFALVTLAVCFPYPRLLARHVRHWRDPNALIQPDAPELAPMLADLRNQLPSDAPPPMALMHVQRFVLDRVKYEWDWNTWGLADYLPTVSEVVATGKEDCDGRAVVAASLLKGLGYDAKLVTDFAHVWVRTEHGDLMGPGKQAAAVATDKGLKVNFAGLVQLPWAFAYGVAVFPPLREIVIVMTAWLLLLRPRTETLRAGLSLASFLAGLYLLRQGSANHLLPVLWMQLGGLAFFVAAMLAAVVPPGRGQSGRATEAVLA
jgi:hypothetical protein